MTFGNSTLPQRLFLPSFWFCFNGIFEALAENTGIPPDAESPMSMTVEWPGFSIRVAIFKAKDDR